MTRRLPPYGRAVAEALTHQSTWRGYAGTSADGRAVSLFVAIGSGAMAYAARCADRLSIAVPPDLDPTSCDWSLLCGHDPILLLAVGDVAGDRVAATVAAMMRDGVERVLYLGPKGLTRHIAEVCQHAA